MKQSDMTETINHTLDRKLKKLTVQLELGIRYMRGLRQEFEGRAVAIGANGRKLPVTDPANDNRAEYINAKARFEKNKSEYNKTLKAKEDLSRMMDLWETMVNFE